MNVKELIAELQQYPDDLEVTISDGFQGKVYTGAYEIKLFDEGIKLFDEWCGDNVKLVVDIGIGGLEVYD
jgi:hypothetical protein